MPNARVLCAVTAVGALAASLLMVDGGLATAATTPTECTSDRFFDINRDGFEDTVVGTPLENAKDQANGKGYADTGTVTILYGDATGTFGPAAGGRSLKMRDLGFSMAAKDHFGASVLVADLNGDHCGDLVIGVPGRNSGAGIVVVAFGSPPGSPGLGNGAPVQILKQGTNGTPDTSEAGDNFGASLAVTRNADGSTKQLWVGAPGEDVAGHADAGLVDVYNATTCTTCTLPTTGITHRRQGAGGVSGGSEAGDKFGYALAGGGTTMLVGSPGEDVGKTSNAGMFHVFEGTTATGYHADTPGVPGTPKTGDLLGRSLAVADSCAGGGAKAWVVGAPYKTIGTATAAGYVIVMDRGTAAPPLTLQQGSGSLNGGPEAGDHFGASLNYTGSTGRTKGVISIGVPGEDVGTSGKKDAGQVMAVSLSCPGSVLRATDFESWTRDDPDIPGDATTDDTFGRTLGSALVKDGGAAEFRLLISVPGGDELSSNGTLVDSGTVLELPSSASGFTSAGSVMFGQGDSGPDDIPGRGDQNDEFGSALDASAAGR